MAAPTIVNDPAVATGVQQLSTMMSTKLDDLKLDLVRAIQNAL